MTEAIPTVQIENATTRVTRWDLPPGSVIGQHVHEYDYIVVPVTDGVITVTTPDGEKTDAPLTTGVSYARAAGVEHVVANNTAAAVSFVEVELLEHPLDGTAGG